MRGKILTDLLLACAACSLVACGGGGGGGGGVPSFPAPPPPPPPTFTRVDIFPAVTTSTEFAALGYEASGSAAIGDGFSVRYDAAGDTYIFDLPAHDPAAFSLSSSNATFWSGGLIAGSILWPPMSVLKPSPTNPEIQLSYTSFAAYMGAGPMDDLPHGLVAFGLATPSSGIPTTGSATFDAFVAGQTLDRFSFVGGTATLQFDFGAGTLAGRFDPVLYPFYSGGQHSLGQYAFVNTVYGVGSTTFSGEFSHSNPLLTGAFNGLFTGPNAQELMARWTAEFVDPANQQVGEIFGVWVAKKCC